MKTAFKTMMALILALLLSAGAVAEETLQTNETGFSVVVSEKEADELDTPRRVFLLFSYDEKDSVLTDEAKKAEAFAAVEILEAATEDTGAELYVLQTLTEPENIVPVEAGEALAQMETILSGRQASDRLDSALVGFVEQLCMQIRNLEGEKYALILGDGALTPGYNMYKSMEEALKEANLTVLYRTIGAQDANATGEAATKLLGASAYRDLPTEGAGLAAANELLEAMGWPTYAPVEKEQEGLFGKLAEVGRNVYGCAKEYEVTAEAKETIYESGKPIAVSVEGLPEGMSLVCLVNGQETELESDGRISAEAVDGGELKVSFVALCDDPAIKAASDKLTIRTAAAPALKENVKAEGLADAVQKEGDGTFDLGDVSELFDGAEGAEFTASVRDNDGFTATIDGDNHLILKGNADRVETKMEVTLSATDGNGFTGTGDISVTITNPAARLSELQLQVQPELEEDYCAGDPVEAAFVLNGENLAAAKEAEACGWTVEAYCVMGDSEAKKLDGDVQNGWTLEVAADDSQEELKVFLTADGTIDDEKPGFEKKLDIYPADEKIDSRWKDADLKGEAEAEKYQIGEEVSITWKFEEVSLLTGARGYDADALAAGLSGEGIERQDDGTYLYHGEEVAFGGDIENGWTLTMPAHKTVNVTIELTIADADGNSLEAKTADAQANVDSAPFLRYLACLADGREVWEEPDWTNLYMIAGGALSLLIVLVLVIMRLFKQKFHGFIVIRVETASGAAYTGNPVDLSVWGKMTVGFGTLLSGSALPPIAALTAPAIMNKLTFKADRKGVRAMNKTGVLQGTSAVQIIAPNETVQLALEDKSMTMWLTYQAGGCAEDGSAGNY